MKRLGSRVGHSEEGVMKNLRYLTVLLMVCLALVIVHSRALADSPTPVKVVLNSDGNSLDLPPVQEPTGGGVSVTSVWTANGDNARQSVFKRGDSIRYYGAIYNGTGRTVTAYFRWSVDGPCGSIASWSGNLNTRSGTVWWYLPARIPTDACAGTYTYHLSVTYQDRTSSKDAHFTVVSQNSHARVVLDPGHGWRKGNGIDSGATANGMKEKDITMDVARRAKTILEAQGVEVYLTHNGDDWNHTLHYAAQFVNSKNPNISISIHVNAGGGTGTESCYVVRKSTSHESKRLAELLTSEISGNLGLGIRGNFPEDAGDRCARQNSTGWRQLYIHDMNPPAALIEIAFIDGPTDNDVFKLKYRRDDFARAIANAALRYLGQNPGDEHHLCPTITQWKGEYWANQHLSGSPTKCRNDAHIDFNWRGGSPDNSIPNDHFSARWTRRMHFEGGCYRFYARADDGIRVWVDGQRIINAWRNQPPTEYRAEKNLSAGEHEIKVEYYENGGGAVAQVHWERISGGSTGNCPGKYRTEYFSNRDLRGGPVYVRCEGWPINHDWGGGSPGHGVPSDHFSARWTGRFHFDGGRYRFIARTDDGMRVWVDGLLVIDAWWDQPPTAYRRETSLSPGDHTVKVEWYENGGGAVAQVRWERVHPQEPHCGDRTEPNNSYNQGYWLQPGQQVEGYICPQNDIDWFRFTVNPGDEVRIRLQSLPADYDMVLYVNNQEVARSERGGTSNEEIVWHARGVGNGTRAYLKVYGWSGAWSRNDSYVLSLEKRGSGGGTSCPNQYKAEYFNNRDLRGSPIFVRCEGWPINHDWGGDSPGHGVPNDNFSARWTGRAHIDQNIYTFIARADDGMRVWLDGQILLNQWKDQAPTEYRIIRRVNGGDHTIKVEFYEHSGGAVAQFRWERGVRGGPGGYTFCANEGERCSFSGTKDVAYGANGQYAIRRRASGGIDCGNHVFGDPAPGIFKACYIKESSNGNPSGPTYEIVATHSGKCLDVEGAHQDDGTNVQQWACGGGPNQRWRLVNMGGGFYEIVAVHSGKCLDVAGGSHDNGANVIQWRCHGGDNQLWRIEPVRDAYRIIAKHSGKALDVAGASPRNGVNVQQWQYGGGPNQLWWLRRR